MNMQFLEDVDFDDDDELENVNEIENVNAQDEIDDRMSIDDQIFHFNQKVGCNNFDGVHGIHYMLKHYDYDIDNSDQDGQTALHRAALNSKPKTVRFFLDRMTNLNTLDNFGESPLMIAAHRGNMEIFMSINIKLETEISPPIGIRSRIHVKTGGATLLMLACTHSEHWSEQHEESLQIVKLLLQNNFDPRVRDDEGKTSLHYALRYTHSEITVRKNMLMLINDVKKDSLVHMKDNDGNTALHIACGKFWGDKLIPFLLEYGARMSDTNLKGETPMHVAARQRISKNINLLVQCGAKRHTQDKMGRTPVHAFIVSDRMTLIRYNPRFSRDILYPLALLTDELNYKRKLSYLEIKDNEGNTPLMSACKMQNQIIIEALIKNEGININAVDNNGSTVIHECVQFALNVTEDLINKDVDIYVLNHDHESPLDLAKKLSFDVRNGFVSLIRDRIEHDKSLMFAFSMIQHKRLGNDSHGQILSPEEIGIIGQQAYHKLFSPHCT